jgi:hypothetical protein
VSITPSPSKSLQAILSSRTVLQPADLKRYKRVLAGPLTSSTTRYFLHRLSQPCQLSTPLLPLNLHNRRD